MGLILLEKLEYFQSRIYVVIEEHLPCFTTAFLREVLTYYQ